TPLLLVSRRVSPWSMLLCASACLDHVVSGCCREEVEWESTLVDLGKMLAEHLTNAALVLCLRLQEFQVLGKQVPHAMRRLVAEGQHTMGGEDAEQHLDQVAHPLWLFDRCPHARFDPGRYGALAFQSSRLAPCKSLGFLRCHHLGQVAESCEGGGSHRGVLDLERLDHPERHPAQQALPPFVAEGPHQLTRLRVQRRCPDKRTEGAPQCLPGRIGWPSRGDLPPTRCREAQPVGGE